MKIMLEGMRTKVNFKKMLRNSEELGLETEVISVSVRVQKDDVYLLGSVNTGFLQTRFRLLKTGFKPVFGFTGLHRNLNFKPS